MLPSRDVEARMSAGPRLSSSGAKIARLRGGLSTMERLLLPHLGPVVGAGDEVRLGANRHPGGGVAEGAGGGGRRP